MTPAEAAWRHGLPLAEDAMLLAEALGQAPVQADRDAAARAAEARLPLAASDLIAAGVTPGPAVGAALKAAERAWIDSGFALDKSALLEATRAPRGGD